MFDKLSFLQIWRKTLLVHWLRSIIFIKHRMWAFSLRGRAGKCGLTSIDPEQKEGAITCDYTLSNPTVSWVCRGVCTSTQLAGTLTLALSSPEDRALVLSGPNRKLTLLWRFFLVILTLCLTFLSLFLTFLSMFLSLFFYFIYFVTVEAFVH